MADAGAIQKDMEVIGADGGHIGTVDGVSGDRIKLTRKDRGAGDKHHYVEIGHVADVEDQQVRLSYNSTVVQDFWTTD